MPKKVWLLLEKELSEEPKEVDNIIIENKTRDGREVVSEDIIKKVSENQNIIPFIEIERTDPSGVNITVEAVEKGAKDIILSSKSRTLLSVIALENIIARTQKYKPNFYTFVNDLDEMRTAARVLGIGTNIIVSDPSLVKSFKEYIAPINFELVSAKVKESSRSLSADRCCIDTAEVMTRGEGMLVRSTGMCYFLVHAETEKTPHTDPRPSRCNCGPGSSYIITDLKPDGDISTKYLHEVRHNSSVLIVDKNGTARRALVNRNKVENRPMREIIASYNGEDYPILLQDADSVYLTSKKGEPIPVTSCLGEEVLIYIASGTTHFGTQILQGRAREY